MSFWYNRGKEKTPHVFFIIHEEEGFVQFQMEKMSEFVVHLGCVRDVEDFVRIATAQPFPVYLDDGAHRVNGKSFMEMFCLSLSQPLRLTADCSPEEFQRLQALIRTEAPGICGRNE